MARPWRVQYEGAIYHIMSRGVGRGEIFLVDDDYLRFISYLERSVGKFKINIFAFVLMSNHFHLFLRTNEANVSRVLHWLQTSYSIYYNRKHSRSGHLFQGRFKSIVVGDESYWQNLSLYIHLNPIRAGIVEELSQYKWSSYNDYVNIKKIHNWVDGDAVLREFGRNKKESRTEYRKLIRGISGKEKEFLEDLKYGMILGSDKFLEWVQDKFIDRGGNKERELPQKKMISDDGILERVIDEIAHSYKIEKASLLKRKRCKPNEARDVGMYILKKSTGLKNREIGEVFGVSESAVNKSALRLSEQIKTRKHIKNKIEKIVYSAFKV